MTKYIVVPKEETAKTLRQITTMQTKRNLFVNVSVKENRKDKAKNTIKIGG